MGFLPLAAAVAIAVWFFRSNILAYVGAIFCLQIAAPLVQMLAEPSMFYRLNGALLLVIGLLVLAWMIVAGGRASRTEDTGTA